MRAPLLSLRHDERGFALAMAVALMTLVTVGSLVVYTLVQDENSKSRRDVTQNLAYQAAEAGTNAYLSDLTQDIGFYNSEVAKGEATRTGDIDHIARPNDCTVSCSDMTWNPAWGTTWKYLTSQTSDKGWYTIPIASGATSQEYQYLIQVTPPNTNLTQVGARLITRVVVTGRPYGSTNTSQWRTIETLLRPSSLADFQAFLAKSETYGPSAVTTGPIFVGEDNSGNPGDLTHQGIAQANLYAEGSVDPGHTPSSYTTFQNGATWYDSHTSTTALCKLNDCFPVPFTTFTNYIGTVASAASSTGGITLPATDTNNTNLSGQTPAYSVDTWKLIFDSTGHVKVYSCKDQSGKADYQGTTAPTCWQNITICPSGGCSTLTPVKFPIYSAADVIVQGTVHGTVTVASADDIIYGGNTSYVTDGVDVLGLEATNNIIIPQWAIYAAANGNITVYSAQFALNGSFEADPDDCSWTGGTNPSGHSTCDSSSQNCNNSTTICLMTINGSSALYGNSNGPILMTNAFGHRNYNYDSNLLFLPPPYFPTLPNAFTILVQREL